MTQTTALKAVAIALNTEGPLPDWIELIPAGPRVVGRDGRAWNLIDPQRVVSAFAENSAALPIDYEHATEIKPLNGDPAPSVGWIEALEVRGGAIWGQVVWTEEGARAVSAREYRYVSPVFLFDPDTTQILRLTSAGLTNQPNLKMAALNRADDTHPSMETEMDKDLLDALGLPGSATKADAIVAINRLKTDEETARNRAENPDPARYVPKADFDRAANRISEFEAADEARRAEEVQTFIDAQVEAGRITPATKDEWIGMCATQDGFERARKIIPGMPVLAKPAQDRGDPADVASNTSKLTADERAMCRAWGMDEDTFAKSKEELEA